MMKNTETTYGSVAKAFHWLLFLMFGFLIVVGNFLAAMPKGPEKLQAAGMHKSFGLIVLTLIVVRLGWRLINETPKAPEETPEILNYLAEIMHWVLYALMLAQPLAGILMTQAAGQPVSFFGLFELPTLLEQEPALAEFFRGAHGVVWILLVLAVIGHAGAGLYHHFIKKDDVLRRMSFTKKHSRRR